MSTNSSDPLRFPTIPMAIGGFSGVLTAAITPFISTINPFTGAVFGAAVTLLVWIKYKSCSTVLAITLMASSVVAYFAAVWTPHMFVDSVRSMLRLEPDYNPFNLAVFSVAGFLGCLIMTLAVYLLLSEEKGLAIVGKACAWSCAGAFLGLISSELREPVGKAVYAVSHLASWEGENRAYDLPFCSAYLIWQMGMALLIALMLPESGASNSRPGQSPIAAVPRAKLSLFSKLFFLCIFATVAILTYTVAHDFYRSWLSRH